MGCGISTEEGWRERLASSERSAQEASPESAPSTGIESFALQRPSRRMQGLLSVLGTRRRRGVDDHRAFGSIVVVEPTPIISELAPSLSLVPEELCDHEVSSCSPSIKAQPTQSTQSSSSTHRMSTLPQGEEKPDRMTFLLSVACSPSMTDDDHSWLPHRLNAEGDSVRSLRQPCAPATSRQAPHQSCTLCGSFAACRTDALDADERTCVRHISRHSSASHYSAQDRSLLRHESCTSCWSSAASSTGALDADVHTCVRDVSRHSSASYNSAEDTAEMLRAEEKMKALQKLCTTPASMIVSAIEQKRANFDSML